MEPRLLNNSQIKQIRVWPKNFSKNTSVIKRILGVWTHKSSQWKWNVCEWLPKQTEHDQMAGWVYLSSIVSVFENISRNWNKLCWHPRFHCISQVKIVDPNQMQGIWSNFYLFSNNGFIFFNYFTQKMDIFTNPSTQAGYDTRSIFKWSVTGLNLEFSFS